jgi:hypothetical protein
MNTSPKPCHLPESKPASNELNYLECFLEDSLDDLEDVSGFREDLTSGSGGGSISVSKIVKN